jgi:heterodisulfide reductase subunit C
MDGEGHSSHASSRIPETIAALVAEATGKSPLDCYQCGRCAAGCLQNVPGEMELSPTRLMRLLQLESAFAGEPERAEAYRKQILGADTQWLCAGCLACTTRCPQGVDIAGTMDVLRQEGLKRKMASRSKRAKDIQALHKVFLFEALRRGRIHEVAMVAGYKLLTGHFLQDVLLAPVMLAKGKMHVTPGESANTQRVRQAMEKLKEEEGGAK